MKDGDIIIIITRRLFLIHQILHTIYIHHLADIFHNIVHIVVQKTRFLSEMEGHSRHLCILMPEIQISV